jgi:hypothetical protein
LSTTTAAFCGIMLASAIDSASCAYGTAARHLISMTSDFA